MKQKTRLITKDDILVQLYKSDFIKDLIWTITSGNQLKEDLKSELFLILFEMDDIRILRAYNNKYLHYLCVNILKKQYHSKTSPFHKKFRWSGKVRDTEPLEWKYNYNSPLETQIEEVRFPEELMEKIIWFVDNKLDLVDRELFKIYYKIGRYDRWLGDLRDTNCKKSISSLRKVENKLAITTIEGKKITIGYDTIRLSLNRSIMRIKYYLKENELD